MSMDEFADKHSFNAKSVRAKFRKNTPKDQHAGQGNRYAIENAETERYLLKLMATTGGNRKIVTIQVPKG